MEVLISPSKFTKQVSSRKVSSGNSLKDLWFVAQQGSVAELDSALVLLKKNGGNIDARNVFGLTPLHIATWRNHIPIVKRLLTAGADPDSRDGESGCSSLHRALQFSHLDVVSILLQSGTSLILEDSKYCTPVNQLSGPVLETVGSDLTSVTTEVFSWGSGINYQLGTSNAYIQKLPYKVDALQDSYIKLIAALKFHSVAVDSRRPFTVKEEARKGLISVKLNRIKLEKPGKNKEMKKDQNSVIERIEESSKYLLVGIYQITHLLVKFLNLLASDQHWVTESLK